MKLTTMTLMGAEWQTEQADLLRLAVRSPISRRDAARLQLIRDLRSWLMWLLLTLAVAAMASLHPGLMVWGGVLTLILGFVFVQVVRGHRRATLLRGVVCGTEQVQRHPLTLGHTAIATLNAGKSTLSAAVVISRREALALLRQNGQVEVLVHFDPQSRYSSILAWRAA